MRVKLSTIGGGRAATAGPDSTSARGGLLALMKDHFGPVRSSFSADLMASIVVFLIAMPLSMGIAIASGVPPALGIVGAIVGGLVVSLIAGSPLLVSGPAAGLAVLIWELVRDHGLVALGPVVLVAGIIQVAAGGFGMGLWFRAVSPGGDPRHAGGDRRLHRRQPALHHDGRQPARERTEEPHDLPRRTGAPGRGGDVGAGEPVAAADQWLDQPPCRRHRHPEHGPGTGLGEDRPAAPSPAAGTAGRGGRDLGAGLGPDPAGQVRLGAAEPDGRRALHLARGVRARSSTDRCSRLPWPSPSSPAPRRCSAPRRWTRCTAGRRPNTIRS